MNELIQIGTVLENGVMTAAEMTHALCDLGGGSMGAGIQAVFDGGLQAGFLAGFPLGFKEGQRQNEINTVVTCAACAAGGAAVTGLVIWGVKKRKAKKRAKDEKGCGQSDVGLPQV